MVGELPRVSRAAIFHEYSRETLVVCRPPGFSRVKTCIYYDLEEVRPEEIQQARADAPGAEEFIARGTRWPDAVDGPAPSELSNSRELDYKTRLMNWMDELFKALERSRARSVLVRSESVSLLEILRYQFLAEFAEVEQRLSAASEMSRQGAERIRWIIPSSDRLMIEKLADGSRLRIDVVRVPRPAGTPNRLSRMFRSCGRKVIEQLTKAADLMGRPPPNPLGAAGHAVAIIEYYPNSAKALVPVAKLLREQHGVDSVWIAARREVVQTLDRFGVASIPLRRLAPRAIRVSRHFPPSAEQILREAIESEVDETIFCGTGSVPGRSFLAPHLVKRLSRLLEESAYWLDSISEALAAISPCCVISTTHSSTVGRAAALAARQRNISSAFVQHGMFPDQDVFTRFCNDELFVWGEANKRTMTRNGICAARIKVVGATIYDDLVRSERHSAQAPFPQPGKPLKIAYMASRTGGLVVSTSVAKLHLTAIARAASQIAGAQLIVKVHPADRTGMIEQALSGFPGVSIVREGSSQEIILQSDIVIVASSTTGLEACIANKPLIVVESKGLSEYGPYREYGAALHIGINDVDAFQRLADAICNLAADPAKLDKLARGRRQLVDDLLNGGKGNASELTALAVLELFRGPIDSICPSGSAKS